MRARRASRSAIVPQVGSLDLISRSPNLQIGRYFGLDGATLRARIPKLLEFAGLANKGSNGIRTLSGGMKRRLTLARALVNDPELLILDEPSTGLDPQARHLIWDGLRQLLTQGKTILLTTHFMDEAERLATRLAVIDPGKMIASDTPARSETHVEPEVIGCLATTRGVGRTCASRARIARRAGRRDGVLLRDRCAPAARGARRRAGSALSASTGESRGPVHQAHRTRAPRLIAMASPQAKRGQVFRRLHSRPGIFAIPNPWDTGSARSARDAGKQGALATASAGYAFLRGRPDAEARAPGRTRRARVVRRPTAGVG
jgi:energy-coupling factor transporter ATP-binding protein EcfA2